MQPPTTNTHALINTKITTPKRPNNSTSGHHHRPHGTTTQACAACKYQRRKCAADCILAPYFPHDRQRQFLNAHRLFGVSNIVKIVRHLDPAARHHAMRTIIFESDARAADPVGGCHHIIRHLEYQLFLARSELDLILHHLTFCRAATLGHHPHDDDPPDVNSSCIHARNNNNNNIGGDELNEECHNNRVRGLSTEDCQQMRCILDHLSVTDDIKFDDHTDILTSSNDVLTRENETFKDDDDDADRPFSYIHDQHDLKAATTFFTLANCDI
ncbi:LOB domain-containing protein [Striga asiatica]|uniref:LOB domain-containing protein n=1 Tax=Striga asiatica TaxID=4170 RepID=A0A5A7R3Y4_STRAF|nr:LOB domain-containing protein [Striga asiatica]